jgi:hypothetical protein
MRVNQYVIGACLLTLTTGCGKFAGKDYGVGSLSDAAAGGYITSAQKLQDAVMKTGADDINPLHFLEKKCFQIPVATGDESTCQQQRNAAIAALMIASDEMCQDHLKGIFGTDAGFNIGFGSLAMISSGLGTIVNGVAAKTALSGVSTMASGERALGNEVVYKNMVVTAITPKIRDAREAKGKTMIPGNFDKGMDNYPMILAFRDLINYHQTCSFMYGLEKVLAEGTQTNPDTKKAKLEQEKQALELYIDNRDHTFRDEGRVAAIAADEGLKGAKARVKAIEEQLLALQNASATSSSQGSKPADPIKITPDKLAFGDNTTEKTIVLKNTRSKAVAISEAKSSGKDFSIEDGCKDKTMDSNSECTIKVKFTCNEAKCERTETLTVTYDTPAMQRTIQLTGKLAQ